MSFTKEVIYKNTMKYKAIIWAFAAFLLITGTTAIAHASIDTGSNATLSNGDDDVTTTNTVTSDQSITTGFTNGDDAQATSSTVASSDLNTNTINASFTNGDDDVQSTTTTTNNGGNNNSTSTEATTTDETGGSDNNTSTTTTTGGDNNNQSGGSIVLQSVSTGTSSGGSSGALHGGASLSCPLITSPLKLGSTGGEVTKLQNFLNLAQSAGLTVNGTFDAATQAAVKAFQTKYKADIMTPWHQMAPSGFVYITTMKKINEIVCNKTISLTDAELAVINAHVATANLSDESTTTDNTVGTLTPNATLASAVTVDNASVTGSSTASATDNTAALGDASFISKIWSIISGWFH